MYIINIDAYIDFILYELLQFILDIFLLTDSMNILIESFKAIFHVMLILDSSTTAYSVRRWAVSVLEL